MEAKLLEGLNSAESDLTTADWSAIRQGGLGPRPSPHEEARLMPTVQKREAAKRALVDHFEEQQQAEGALKTLQRITWQRKSPNGLA